MIRDVASLEKIGSSAALSWFRVKLVQGALRPVVQVYALRMQVLNQ
jgi:hypothetical protein